MAAIDGHRLTFGSCVLLMITSIMGRVVQSIDSAHLTEGIYPVETKRDAASDSEMGEFIDSTNLKNSYDEYPMIVPKRAALLLDRLMVALHHALEEERNDRRRISEIYGRERTTPTFLLKGGSLADFDPTEQDNMYSDEEQPDFDLRNLRDLKSANRGSGETLMGKSFQRRAPHDDDSASGRSNGRMYWRCYFNAVSCF